MSALSVDIHLTVDAPVEVARRPPFELGALAGRDINPRV